MLKLFLRALLLLLLLEFVEDKEERGVVADAVCESAVERWCSPLSLLITPPLVLPLPSSLLTVLASEPGCGSKGLSILPLTLLLLGLTLWLLGSLLLSLLLRSGLSLSS